MTEDARILHDPDGVLRGLPRTLPRSPGPARLSPHLARQRLVLGPQDPTTSPARSSRFDEPRSGSQLSRQGTAPSRGAGLPAGARGLFRRGPGGAGELVELALKALLRLVGVEPPHHHDVGGLLLEHGGRSRPSCASGSRVPPRSARACAGSESWPSTATSTSSPPRNTPRPTAGPLTTAPPSCLPWPRRLCASSPGLASRRGPARRRACRPSTAPRRRSPSAGSRRAGTRSR